MTPEEFEALQVGDYIGWASVRGFVCRVDKATPDGTIILVVALEISKPILSVTQHLLISSCKEGKPFTVAFRSNEHDIISRASRPTDPELLAFIPAASPVQKELF